MRPGQFTPDSPRYPQIGQANGRWRLPMERFVEKLAFDPFTGCVMWIGGTSAGSNHAPRYGVFWHDGRKEYAHRFAAREIHGFNITGLQVDHNCPCGPSTLCVEHVKPETLAENNRLRDERPGRTPSQTNAHRQYWLLVHKGVYEPEPLPERAPSEVPFYTAPAWLAPYLKKEYGDDCPF